MISLGILAASFVLCPFRRNLVLNRYNLGAILAVIVAATLGGWQLMPLLALVSLWGGGWFVRVMLARSVSLRILLCLAAGLSLQERQDIEGRCGDLIRYRLAVAALGGYTLTRWGRRVSRATRWAAA